LLYTISIDNNDRLHTFSMALNRSLASLWTGVALFWLTIFLAPKLVDAQLFYTVNGQPMQVDAIQLWYNGYWKHVRLVNSLLGGQGEPWNVVSTCASFIDRPHAHLTPCTLTLPCNHLFITSSLHTSHCDRDHSRGWRVRTCKPLANSNLRIFVFLTPLQPGWINGTLVSYQSCTDCEGKILLWEEAQPPYDEEIKAAKRKGAIAAVMYRDRAGVPGQGMYYVTGDDQLDLTIPVVEVYQRKAEGSNRLSAAIPPNGGSIEIQCWPMTNQWKEANDKAAFQIVWNVILSSLEIGIICLSLLRLDRWFHQPGTSIFSIGPLCIVTELLGAIVRFALTVVDPYFSLRLLPAVPGMILTSASFPFAFASGILLTFFWAESLSSYRVQATPFIADYKKSAIVVIVILFVGEFSTSITRALVPVRGSFSPIYLAQAFYVITATTLIVCYLICAYKITQKLKSFNRGRKSFVRKMTLRFALSTSGYVLFIVVGIISIPLLTRPWPFKVLLNLLAFSCNLAGILQVYGLSPPSTDHHTTSSSTGAAKNHSHGDTAASMSAVGQDSTSDDVEAQRLPHNSDDEDSISSAEPADPIKKLPMDAGETAEQKTLTTEDTPESSSSSASLLEESSQV
jgi:hypothetical protein